MAPLEYLIFYFLDGTLCVIKSCPGVNKIAELGPNEIFNFQILIICVSLLYTIEVYGIHFLSI